MRFGRHRRQLIASGASLDRLAAIALFDPCFRTNATAVEAARRWREHHPELGCAMLDQSDIDGVIIPTTNEFLGAVQWIDEEEGVVVGWDSPRRHFLFSDDGYPRRSARECGQDDQLGRSVGLRYRRMIVLGFNVETAPDHLDNGLARFACRLGEIVEEAHVINHQ